MNKRILIPIALIALLVVSASVVFASTQFPVDLQSSSTQIELGKIRKATAQYQRVEVAEEDGFVPLFDCIENPNDSALGAMGIHYIQPARFDAQLDLEQPEVLVYEPQSNGRLKLVAVEFIIPAAAWPEDAPVPEFLGQELKYKTSMGKYDKEDGIDPYYELHAWIWKNNPAGIFEDWNPKVSCP
jgi:hypothetical protein